MLQKVAVLKSNMKDKNEIINFIIESNKVALKNQKELHAVLYLEKDEELELYFVNNESHETKTAFWDDVLEYIMQYNIDRFCIAGDYRMRDIKTGKIKEALVVTYLDKSLTIEQYTIPYQRKLLKGIVFDDIEKIVGIDLPYHENILDYWEFGNKNFDKGLRRYYLSYCWRIYFPRNWNDTIDEEDGHNIFCFEDGNPTVHISVLKPEKKDGSIATKEELQKWATPAEYIKERKDLEFESAIFTIKCFENKDIIENGEVLKHIQCGIVSDSFLIIITIIAKKLESCEQAIQYLKTLTKK